MWICEKCKFWTEFFIITKKDKVYFLIVIKKTKHTFYSSLQKKTKALLTQLSKKKTKRIFSSSRALQKQAASLASWAILEFKPCLTHKLPRFEFMVFEFKNSKKGDEITTLNSRRHLCLVCSLLLCLFLWQPCKHRPLRLRHLKF